jgi:hypothetical protein
LFVLQLAVPPLLLLWVLLLWVLLLWVLLLWVLLPLLLLWALLPLLLLVVVAVLMVVYAYNMSTTVMQQLNYFTYLFRFLTILSCWKRRVRKQ